MGMSETLKAISDPVRRDILEMLKQEKKSAGEIAEKFNLTNATVSYHLSQLKKADLILEDKFKNFIYYELNTSVFEDVLAWIYGLGGKKNEKNWLENVNHHLHRMFIADFVWGYFLWKVARKDADSL